MITVMILMIWCRRVCWQKNFINALKVDNRGLSPANQTLHLHLSANVISKWRVSKETVQITQKSSNSSKAFYYVHHVRSGKRNVTVWRPSIFYLSVCLVGILTVIHQGQHATRPAYISARQLGEPTYLHWYESVKHPIPNSKHCIKHSNKM